MFGRLTAHRGVVALLPVVILAGLPSPRGLWRAVPVTEAHFTLDQCLSCGDRLDGFGNIEHSFAGSGGSFTGAPNSVHTDWQANWCAAFHNFCQQASTATADIHSALAADDPAAVRAALKRHADIARYDAAVGVIDVRCPFSGVVTSFPVDPDMVALAS